jgi:putative hydrolase of the HAD superfamily
VILNGLGRSLPDSVFQRLVADHGRMEVAIPPDPIDGVEAALERLSGRYKLAVVSDAIVTPGTGLRAILEGHGLARYFSGFAFSDEVGHSKPHRSMFESAAGQLGVGLDEIVHIGDRDHNDVKGPHALGAKAILFVATRDVDKDATTADAVCASYRELPAIVDRLSAGN